jgi:hypothetical protein
VRLVFDEGNKPQVTNVFSGQDVEPDNREHEITTDLREAKAAGQVKNIGLWIESGENGPATFELIGMSFGVDEKTKNEAYKDDKSLTFYVTDHDDKPIAGAKVTVDAERLNFSRTASTSDKGEVSITPLSNETQTHSVRVEKDGIVMSEWPAKGGDRQVIKTVAASYYGGTAKGEDGKPIVRGMVHIKGAKDLKDTIGRDIEYAIVTDSSGRWTAPPMPEDASKLTVELSYMDENQNAVANNLDASTLKRSPPLRVMSVPSAGGSSTTKPVASAAPPTKPAGSSGNASASAATKPAANPTITVQKVDDTSVTGTLSSFKEGQLVLAPKPGETVKLPLEDVVEMSFKGSSGSSGSSSNSSARISSLISASTQPGASGKLKACMLELVGGDKLTGELLAWSDRKLSFKFDGGSSPVSIPIEQVNMIWCASQDQIKKAQALNETSKDEDIAFAARESDAVAVRGVAIGFDAGNLLFRFNNEDRKIPLTRLIGVALAHPETDAPKQPPFEQVVSISGSDQMISGKLTAIEAGAIELTKWDQPIKLPIDKVSKITCRNGRLAYLSDLKPESVEQTPFFDRVYTYAVDKSLDGKPLVLQDGTYPRGIAVHSQCHLTYDLGGRYDEFRSKLGFQQPEGKLGNATVRVTGDGKVLFEKEEARGDQPIIEIKAPLSGVQKLTIEVNFGKNQDVADRVVWANARVLRTASK